MVSEAKAKKSGKFSKTTFFENFSPYKPKFLSEAKGRGWEFEGKNGGSCWTRTHNRNQLADFANKKSLVLFWKKWWVL